MRTRLIAGSLVVFLAVSAAWAQTPLGTAFTYQGRLEDAGSPANGLYDLRFRLYDAAAGGTQVGTTVCADNVSVTDGLFTVPLDFGAQFAGQERFLEIEVRADTGLDCADPAGFIILAPRQSLTGVPNALFSLNADLLDGLDSTAFLQSIPDPLTLSNWSASYIIQAENVSYYDGAMAIYGLASYPYGTTYGVYGVSASPDGRGVFGQASAGTGFCIGGRFGSLSTSGRGVWATASAATGFTCGVWGETASTNGNGVVGQATAASGSTYGVVGEAFSPTGIGVYGSNPSPDGYGVFSAGRLGASGTKSFRIDHPDDPENKYLLHYSAESPEVINFYSGKATLDAAGQAVVELPHYFARINKDPRYTLTAVGAPMPMLHVAEEIDEAALSAGEKAGPGEAAPVCSFRIAGGAPGKKVSWEVKAVRNDLWARTHGAPVEVEKPGPERGKYQHPELYGQPRELGAHYQPVRAPVERAGADRK